MIPDDPIAVVPDERHTALLRLNECVLETQRRQVESADELARCLAKYQSRYHGADHAQKDWEASKLALDHWAKARTGAVVTR